MSTVTVVQGSDRRTFSLDRLPITIGGANCDVEIVAPPAGEPLAYLAHDGGHFFLQPAPGVDDPPAVNGLQLSASTWLADGDRLVIAGRAASCRIADGDLTVEFQASSRPQRPTITKPSAPPPPADLVVEPIPFTPRWQQTRARRRLRVPLRVTATAALLAVLGLGAWFVLTARAVRIETVPADARLEVSGGFAVRIGDRYLMRPGHYRVTASHPGHFDLEGSLGVTPHTPSDPFVFSLTPVGTELTVVSRPVSGARVSLDGAVIGSTPLRDHALPAGSHRLEVVAPRHRPATRELEIAPGEPPLELEIELEPDWAPVVIASEPRGAAVVIDGDTVGTTPTTAEVASGERELELRADGFQPYRQRLQVTTGERLDLGTIRLRPRDGILAVSSEPPQASLTIDGQFRGTTPLEVAVEPATDIELRLTRAGHATYRTTLQVASGERRELRAELSKLTGDVVITSSPPGAEVLVDGTAVGTTGQRLVLEARRHQIEVRLAGYRPFSTAVTPQPGQTATIHAELREEGPAGLPQTAATPQEVAMVLVPPIRFTMGAPRREPGRRSNEVLREVEISRAFYLAVSEVSNREFREFRPGHRSGAHAGQNLEIDHHPVVRVTWEDAARYCNWLSERAGLPPVYAERGSGLEARDPLPLGFRLPTEAEWAAAARFADTAAGRKYIWGDALPVPSGSDNWGDGSTAATLGAALPGYRDDHAGTAPVGSYSPNPLGIFNLGGNVREWIHDLYAVTPSAPSTVVKDPAGPAAGPGHVIRGAGWTTTSVNQLRLSYRDLGDGAYPDVGFRVARTAP